MIKFSTVSLTIAIIFLLNACKDHPQPAAQAAPKTDSPTTKYFPIAEFLQSEIRNIDTSALAILNCQIVNKHTDSSFLTANEFNRVAATFLTDDLIPDSLEKNYTESSFADKTTGYFTFTYSPKDKSMPLQRIDVLLAQGGDGVNRVKSIYMERSGHNSDTLVVKKMYWQAGRSLEVTTNLQAKGHVAGTRQQKVVWNPEEAD